MPHLRIGISQLSRDVASLRKAYANEYIFQPDVVVACLEARQLLEPRPDGGAVVKLLCKRDGAAGRLPVPWAAVYQCYGCAKTGSPAWGPLDHP